tara:strand:- start:1253 stop:1495 length:243 start_codon:yes stop_codon:yes gene_type:complete
MNNEEKYKNVFTESFSVDSDVVDDTLEYNGIPEWDSIGHMSLIAGLEEAFSISIDTDDIIDFSSYKKGKEILSNNYKIKF